MPKAITVSSKGLKQAIKNVERAGDLSSARTAVDSAAGAVMAAVLSKTPQGPTGNLRRSIKMSRRPPFIQDPEKLKSFVYADASTAPHALLVEFGHGGKRPAQPNPFFRPAVEAMRGTVLQILKAGLRRAVKR